MKANPRTYTAPPSALRFMLLALRPSSGWQHRRAFPDLCLTWKGFQIGQDALQALQDGAHGGSGAGMDRLAVLLPHVCGFRLQMAMLSHPTWPLPVWGSLQVRNRLVLHQPLQLGEPCDLVTTVGAWRVLEKGIEVDLHTQLHRNGDCAWESVVTFYYRGRFGEPTEHGAALGAPPAAPVVEPGRAKAAQWRVDGTRRWQFGALTGDYNGIHQWDAYARRLGFPAAFSHSQRMVGTCLAQLAALDGTPQQLDLWIKGPLFYQREVVMRQQACAGGVGSDFAVCLADDPRPALIGSWRKLPAT